MMARAIKTGTAVHEKVLASTGDKSACNCAEPMPCRLLTLLCSSRRDAEIMLAIGGGPRAPSAEKGRNAATSRLRG